MGKGNFDRLQNRHPSTDHQKICHRWLCQRPLQLCKIRCTSVHACFWANGWNITKIIFIYSPFWELTYRSDPSTDFHAWWFKRHGLAQGCAFLGFVHMAFHLEGQNPHFGGVNKPFQAKLAKSKNMRIIKTNASITTKYCTVIKTTKCPLWVVPTHASQIQDGGRRHLEKIEKSYTSAVVRAISTKFGRWRSSTLLTVPTVKIYILKIQDGGWPPSWKIEKCSINGHY